MNEEFERIKLALENANHVADVKNNPVVDSVLLTPVKAIPVIGEMVNSTTNKLIEDFQRKKEQELVDYILKDESSITTDMVNDVEFIINYNRTLEVVRRLATNDKVKFFGNLIRNGYLSVQHIENSEFEEYLDVLNNMSYREIQALVAYFKYCNGKHAKEYEKYNIWYSFSHEYSSKMKIKKSEIYRIFSSIARTGFVQAFYVTASNHIEKSELTETPAKQDGFFINASFYRFYHLVLHMDE